MDIGLLERNVKATSTMKGADKKIRAKTVLKEVMAAEKECALDFSIPFDTVQRLRALIPKIQSMANDKLVVLKNDSEGKK